MRVGVNIHKPDEAVLRVRTGEKYVSVVIIAGNKGEIDVTAYLDTSEEVGERLHRASEAFNAARVRHAVDSALRMEAAEKDATEKDAAAQAAAEASGYATPAEAVAATTDVEEPF